MDPSKNLPQGCVLGGIEQSKNYKGPLYIGRKQIENELVIGKVINDWKSGYCKLTNYKKIFTVICIHVMKFNFYM